jgi:hypothetical protein
LIDGAKELDFKSLSKYKSIGITAGASAPESIVQSVVKAISLELNTVAEELVKTKKIYISDCLLSYADLKLKKFYVLNIIHYTVSMSRGKT